MNALVGDEGDGTGLLKLGDGLEEGLAEAGTPGGGEVVEMLFQIIVCGFLAVGGVELGYNHGVGDFVGGGIMPESIEVEVVGAPVGRDGDVGMAFGPGGLVGEETGAGTGMIVKTETEVVGGSTRDGPTDGDQREVCGDIGGVEGAEGAVGEQKTVGQEECTVGEGIVINMLDEEVARGNVGVDEGIA